MEEIKIDFFKYQGTGNDFVMVDNRLGTYDQISNDLVAKMCHRRFGVGADGFILLENDKSADFKMVYYNSDGNQSTMCGNGGRCIVKFAKDLGIIENSTLFNAIDGLHHATVQDEMISLKMNDVHEISQRNTALFLNTGSPHHVQEVVDLVNLDVYQEGRRLRYGLYGSAGANINFIIGKDKELDLRTYERGVEDETYSCGTGATAAAIAWHHLKKTNNNDIIVNTKGGKLSVQFQQEDGVYKNVTLSGPAIKVYEGIWKEDF